MTLLPRAAARDRAFRKCVGAAAEPGTGALTDAAFSRHITSEQTPAPDLLPSFGPGMVILADWDFLSHVLARADLGHRRAHPVARLRQLRPHARAGLPDGTWLTEFRRSGCETVIGHHEPT